MSFRSSSFFPNRRTQFRWILSMDTCKIMRRFLLLTVLLFSEICFVSCYSTGAPPQQQVCFQRRPNHNNVIQQNGQAPFQIFVQPNFYTPCQSTQQCMPLTVTIRATGGQIPGQMMAGQIGFAFKGFMVQANAQGQTRSIGYFAGDNRLSKLLDCGANGQSITHVNNVDKNQVTFQWLPQPGYNGAIMFAATVVQRFDTYWMNVRSQTIMPQANTIVSSANSRGQNMWNRGGMSQFGQSSADGVNMASMGMPATPQPQPQPQTQQPPGPQQTRPDETQPARWSSEQTQINAHHPDNSQTRPQHRGNAGEATQQIGHSQQHEQQTNNANQVSNTQRRAQQIGSSQPHSQIFPQQSQADPRLRQQQKQERNIPQNQQRRQQPISNGQLSRRQPQSQGHPGRRQQLQTVTLGGFKSRPDGWQSSIRSQQPQKNNGFWNTGTTLTVGYIAMTISLIFSFALGILI